MTYGFAGGIAVGTALLMLPAARVGDGGAGVLAALFTATSAVCVTGLTVVDTATYWSPLGQALILGLIQVGGLGIMTLASLLGLLISRRMGMRDRLMSAYETKTVNLNDLGSVLTGVVRFSLGIEAVVALLLAGRFWLSYGYTPGRALWLGVFHAVSAFNNAGFGLWSDNLVRFVADPFVCLPVAVAVILGGLGFPVLFELRRQLIRPRSWSFHTKITMLGTAFFLVAGMALLLAAEWDNDRTLGPLGPGGKLLAAFFSGVQPRTAGFNSLDIAGMNPETWLGTSVLMFVGGGSAGTAGGLKVTTVIVLFLIMIAEVRGDRDVTAFGRRIPTAAQRQALTVALLGVATVVGCTFVFTMTTPFTLDQSLFEVTSAFGTVGLTTGITAELSPVHQLMLVVLMFLGRTGTVTLATAIALRDRELMYRLPEEQPIIG